MKVKHLFITKSSRRVAVVLALLLSVLIVVPVLADYLGPDRTETIYVNRRKHCHYNAVYDPPGPGYDTCYLDLYTTPGGSCPPNVASYFNHTYCGGGWPDSCESSPCSITPSSSIESCNAGDTGCRSMEQTVTHPPATISGNINCQSPGDNGYCIDKAASLSLSGNEPLSGYSIIALEGTHNGTSVYCDGDSCSINLVEGGNDFTFWALSDWGDSSLMGNASRSVDTHPPNIIGTTSGSTGSGAWYVSQVTIDASASDPSPGSNLASFQASVDGGGWFACNDPIILGDGTHTVELLARDNAGWTDSQSLSFQIDTIAPTTVFTDPTGTTWATGTITLSGVSSDLNLSGAELSYNGGSSWSGLSPDGSGNWSTAWDTQTVSNGSYSVRARGRDLAGNVGNAASVTIMVDNGEPHIYIPASWPIWQRVSINVVDNGIGVDHVRLTIHGGSYGERVYNWNSGQDDFLWDRYIDGVSMPIGGYPVEVEAWDRVGNKGAAWGEIVIPAPDEVEEEDPGVLSIEPSEEPSEPPVTSGGGESVPQPTNTPRPPSIISFGMESSAPEATAAGEITPPTGSSNLLAGAAAVSAISAATAYTLRRRRLREEEEKRRARAAAAFNAQQRALEEYRARKRAWEIAMQRAAELAAIGAAVVTVLLASKGYLSLSAEPECQYRYGISQCASGRVPEGCTIIGANGLMRCFDEDDPRSPVIPPAIPRDASESINDPYPGTEKNEPSNITFFPEEDSTDLIQFWADGISRDTNAAQFIPLHILNEKEGKENEVLWSEEQATGLCGEVSIAAILNAIKDDAITVQEVVSDYVNAIASGQITRLNKTSSDRDPSYTGPGELQQFIDKRYGDILDADATHFHWSNWLDIYDYQWESQPGEVYDLIHNWLDNQQYTIAGVEIVNGSSGNSRGGWVGDTDNKSKIVHWVVITGISSEFDTTNTYSPTNWVRIYNPFDNSTEYYWYPQFMEAWVEGGNLSLTVTVKEE